jgi:hypothetical protein
MSPLVRAAPGVLFAALLLAGCPRDLTPPVQGEVPRTDEPLAIDGKLSEDAWKDRALTATFVDGSAEAQPRTQIRMLRDDKTLYVAFTAADPDIQSTDAIQLVIPPLVMWFDPRGLMKPVVADAEVAATYDRTIDNASDVDKEWTVEVALPIRSLPLEATLETTWIHAARCDVGKGGKPRCGGWNGPLTLTKRPPRT